MVRSLADWLAGWLPVWLAGSLAVWLAGWSGREGREGRMARQTRQDLQKAETQRRTPARMPDRTSGGTSSRTSSRTSGQTSGRMLAQARRGTRSLADGRGKASKRLKGQDPTEPGAHESVSSVRARGPVEGLVKGGLVERREHQVRAIEMGRD